MSMSPGKHHGLESKLPPRYETPLRSCPKSPDGRLASACLADAGGHQTHDFSKRAGAAPTRGLGFMQLYGVPLREEDDLAFLPQELLGLSLAELLELLELPPFLIIRGSTRSRWLLGLLRSRCALLTIQEKATLLALQLHRVAVGALAGGLDMLAVELVQSDRLLLPRRGW